MPKKIFPHGWEGIDGGGEDLGKALPRMTVGDVLASKTPPANKRPRWIGDVRTTDDFGRVIEGEFIDGRTVHGGRWAIMTPASWREHGGTGGKLGTGLGQRYVLEPDNVYYKVEG